MAELKFKIKFYHSIDSELDIPLKIFEWDDSGSGPDLVPAVTPPSPPQPTNIYFRKKYFLWKKGAEL